MSSANRLKCFEERFARNTDSVEQLLAFGALYLRECQKKVFGRHILVAEIFRFLLCTIEYLCELAREIWLRVALLRITGGLGLRALTEGGNAHTQLLEHRDDD